MRRTEVIPLPSGELFIGHIAPDVVWCQWTPTAAGPAPRGWKLWPNGYHSKTYSSEDAAYLDLFHFLFVLFEDKA